MLNGVISLGYAGTCTQTLGREECISPIPPHYTGPWTYTSATNQTPIGDRATLDEAVQDFFLYQEKANNWDLSSVGSYYIKTEDKLYFLAKPFDYLPFLIRLNVNGPYVHRDSNPSWVSEWGWGFFKRRPNVGWECPKNTGKTDTNYNRLPPFYCRPLAPPRQCSPSVGNPCSITTGNKYQREVDWQSPTSDFKFFRTFQSLPTRLDSSPIWTHNFNSRLVMYMPKPDSGERIDQLEYMRNETQPDIKYTWGVIVAEDGSETSFNIENLGSESTWRIGQNKKITITLLPNKNWEVTYLDKKKEIYNEYGQLIKVEYSNGQVYNLSYENNVLSQVVDRFGQVLKFGYDSQGLMTSLTLPNKKQVIYQYDTLNRLSSVTRPGYGTKIYHYSENSTVAPSGNPNLLTGITDESGKRYANYAYDNQDRGVLTEHAGGSQRYNLTYNNGSTSLTDPSGAQWSYVHSSVSGTPKISIATRQYVTQQQNTYDEAGNLTKKIEKGQTTTYSYDLSRNLETSRTEAVGTAQERTINTIWHSDFPKPTQTQEVSQGVVVRTTVYTYDAQGNTLSKTITDPQTQENRTWSYEYNNFGQMTKQVAPNGEQIVYQYDEVNGNLLSSTDAYGVITTYSQHNADGQPTQISKSTGQVTELIYDDAGRVIQQKQTLRNDELEQLNSEDGLSWWQQFVNAVYALFNQEQPYSDMEQKFIVVANQGVAQQSINSYEYDPRGLLISTTLADGERIEYTYDDAHRLTEIKDQAGNRTVYTLNGNGDITQSEVYGVAGQLEAKTQQVYDNLGRLQQTLGNSQQIQTRGYDNYDRQISDKNALNQSYAYAYDALGRQNKETDPLNKSSNYEYDALDQLKKVIDAKGGTTTYQYNAFGEVIQQNSLDTGTTNYHYQSGKLLEKVDANQRKHRYEYDAQGRITLQQDQFVDGTDQYENTTFAYGQTGNDQGKLVQANNNRAETDFTYNDLGLVRQKSIKYLSTQQSTAPELKVHYAYSLGGKLKQVGLPSGNIVNYDYDIKGQLAGIRLNNQSFISNIQHSVNGIKGWQYSQVGDQVQFQYDLDGRVKKILMPNVFEKDYSYDTADRILAITDPTNSNINSSFKHDVLSRLIEQNLANKTFKYSYDANSNRLTRTQTENGSTTTENYTVQVNNNRINTITQGSSSKRYSYLPTGQITSDGNRSYSYNAQGRSESINTGASSSFNIYDAFGQRIQKIGSYLGNQTQTLFVYDESGQLLGEYTPQGQVIREYIWLENRLVGLRSYQYPNEILRVHTDHLGTPRAISNSQNEVLWRWEGDQFGDVQPTGNLTLPIRHAGQYYDKEVNLFYNYFRDYDPITGRYVESDPIGLDGGLNTYGYVGGNALHLSDSSGLFPDSVSMTCSRNPAFCAEVGIIAATSPTLMSPPKPIPNNPAKEEKCEKENDCGPYSRVQAYNVAQTMAHISKKNRYKRPINDSSLNKTSQGKCYIGLKSVGATHLGYGCEWQKSWIEDHPDGHSHQPGVSHHDCPHLHVYKNGISVGIVEYKRGTF
ncbi:RHS repeat protein [Acinetobacter junii]|nr:RHS repeat protein [Acinetobacter junii]